MALNITIITRPDGKGQIIALTCFRECPVPGNEILWSHRTRDDEGEGEHDGEAKEQGEEEDCSSPVGQFGKMNFLAGLLLQLCC